MRTAPTAAGGSLLQIDNLKTHFFTRDGVVKAVDGVTTPSRVKKWVLRL